MKHVLCCIVLLVGGLVFSAEENKDHGTYSPTLSRRASGDTDSNKDYVGYSNESDFSNFDKEKSNTYKMSVLPPSGGSFIKNSTCNGEVTKDESSNVEGKKIYAKNAIPSSTYIIEMSGKLGFSGGTGGSPATWGAYVRNKYFWIEPTEKIVAEGTAVTITTHGVSTESTWTVNNKVWKDWRTPNSSAYTTSAISLNRDMWDKMQWTPSPVPDGWSCPPSGVYNISANTTEGSGVQAADATLYCIKITVNATDLFGTVEKNDDGSNKTAYVHWNIDNDNNANSGEPTKHLGGDYLKTNMTVNGEDDLKSFSFTMTPAINKGSIEISIGSKGKVWKNATKGVSSGVNSQLLLDAGATKVWDLSNVVQRNEFNGIGTVYIEGVGNGNATFTIKYKDDKGTEIASDHISYTFIAANCGNQPLVNRKTVFLNAFPRLVGCEWSVTGEATISYNCIAWTVGITDKWVNAIGITGLRNNRYYISIDTSYGNGDGIMTMDELDAFYDANGYTVTDSSSADIMYYSKYHGARKKRCSDGAGKWEMFESKCGELERIEHLRDQLNGDLYGFPVRYYKAK